ncbi:MAG: ArdC family protein, partial [Deltaproteobacteria bacterium]|nr:ArdC family protein [Deltaproteobacteria bacterium]
MAFFRKKDPPLPLKSPREAFAEMVIELMAQETAPWQKPWRSNAWAPFNPYSGTVYKGVNRVLLALKNTEDPRWY